jgi:hypothetical protein
MLQGFLWLALTLVGLQYTSSHCTYINSWVSTSVFPNTMFLLVNAWSTSWHYVGQRKLVDTCLPIVLCQARG